VSPTFLRAVRFEGDVPLVHVDAYRMKGPEDFVELGLDEDIAAGACVAVEWAGIVEAALPADRLVVRLDHAAEDRRRAHVEATGPRSLAWLEAAGVSPSGANPK
jgi:tRNA A37 threonylcarbamoyladenosine biosynthesis protein TsaE